MKKNYYRGFFYETEDELREKLPYDEYHDFVFEKREEELRRDELIWVEDVYDDYSTLSMDMYVMRSAEGLTQKEFAEKLGISVSTLSKVEIGLGNISKNVKNKIQIYIDEQY